MTQRNMAEAIDNPVHRKYAAGCGEIRDQRGGDRAAGFIRPRMMITGLGGSISTVAALHEVVNELSGALFPSLHHRKEGRAASSKRFRAATEADAAGVVFRWIHRKTTPASLSADASRYFVDCSATPPCGD